MNRNKSTKSTMQQARVLGGFNLDGVQYNSNDIIEADQKIIKQLGSSVDVDGGAIERRIKLDNSVIKKHAGVDSE
ncbi:MAG: hypothetical protein K2Q13_04010 [Nitrosomonas sp.]|uniref:hypothetical protein n=1 Tax=Nitrosomonas sp. TaxID=42353 RepID=UPI0025EA3D15|nr:hypothetical protein [Nitrosomonas sp.]MBY0474212.1 hypothetical protein [Nitrosomonas sp.]